MECIYEDGLFDAAEDMEGQKEKSLLYNTPLLDLFFSYFVYPVE